MVDYRKQRQTTGIDEWDVARFHKQDRNGEERKEKALESDESFIEH